MSFALPARQVTFGRSNTQQIQPYQPPQAPAAQHGLALPSGSNPYLSQASSSGLALPGPSPLSQSHTQTQPQAQPSTQQLSPKAPTISPPNGHAAAGPSTSSSSTAPVPSTPAPLTLEQQHITAVEGIVPTLQNIVATVNLDCRLDLKTIALHARNAEYNPKVCMGLFK